MFDLHRSGIFCFFTELLFFLVLINLPGKNQRNLTFILKPAIFGVLIRFSSPVGLSLLGKPMRASPVLFLSCWLSRRKLNMMGDDVTP